jgi:NADH:ubiquinone oxidoreductase subunit 2 (subunit N)
MYLDEPDTPEKVQEPTLYLAVFAVAVGLIIGIGLFPQPILNFASNAVKAIAP